MTDRAPLASFDRDVVVDTASEHDVTAERLTTLARTHQSNVRELPGVDDIVYEWRNYFHLDPLVAQTPETYYLALPDHVWDEFADDIGATDTERTALLTLHDRQARRDAPTVGLDTDRFDTDHALVLTRP